MKLKMTEWFPGTVKPVHVGWYPVKAGRNDLFCDNLTLASVKRTRRYWNGERWLWKNWRGSMVNAILDHADKWCGFMEEQK